jgi:hypothetical protein
LIKRRFPPELLGFSDFSEGKKSSFNCRQSFGFSVIPDGQISRMFRSPWVKAKLLLAETVKVPALYGLPKSKPPSPSTTF